MNVSTTGVIGNPLNDPKIINGFKSHEVLPASSPVVWLERADSALRTFDSQNQDGCSGCVAFTKAKQLAIEVFLQTGVYIPLSPASIYQLRPNAPGLGMNISEANDIVNKRGATFEAYMKSQNLSEAQINAVKRTKVAGLLADAIAEAVVNYIYFTDINIDSIAQVIEQGKAVSLLLFANFDEYITNPEVLHPNLKYEDAQIRHEVVAVDYRLKNGIKTLRIEDSAHFGNVAVRDFTEDFINRHVILADYLAIFDMEGGVGTKPHYDGTIISLQKCLKWEGCMPQEVIESEVYGPQTKAAVVRFQVKYNIQPSVGTFGPLTKAKIQSLYP